MNMQDLLKRLQTLGETSDSSGQQGNTNSTSQENAASQGRIFGKKIIRSNITGIIILGLIVIAGFTSFFMVDETEQAVVLTLGKYDRTESAGLHFKLPFGIERNYNVPTQIIQKQSFGFRTARADVVSTRSSRDYSNESTMLTGDLNIVNVEWIIQYRINDPRAWLFNVEHKEKTIRDISISVVNQLVGDYYITDILGDARTEIEENALVNMNDLFQDYQIGVTVSAVRLQNIVPPEGQVQDAFEDVNKAIQDMNRLINEGREEYNKEIPKSRGQAEQLIQQAQGYSAERINQSEGDVARFRSVLQEYNRAPQITRNRIYYETIENILENSSDETKFLDSNFENLLPVLPLNGNRNSQLTQ